MHLFEDIWFVTSSGLIDWETQAAKTVLNYSIFKIAVDDKWLLKIDHLSLGTLAAVGVTRQVIPIETVKHEKW